MDKLAPVALLMDELKNDDIQLRLNSIRNLPRIASGMGEERTQQELLPFIQDSLQDEDEVLFALAEELGKFTDFVGGPSFVHLLFPALEVLAGVEESFVRDKAIQSLTSLSAHFTDKVLDEFLKMWKRLATSEWFQPRTSACCLFHIAYNQAPLNAKPELLSVYKALAADTVPMVKRSAFADFKLFVGTLMKDTPPITEVLAILQTLSKDDLDTVRLLAVENAVALGTLMGTEFSNQHLKPLLLGFSADKSWRVRYMFGSKIGEIISILGKNQVQAEALSQFLRLLKDPEAEVRVASTSAISALGPTLNLDAGIAKTIISAIRSITGDESYHVREALAPSVFGLASFLGKEGTTEHILPILSTLLKDEEQEVRHSVVSHLGKVVSILGVEELSQHLLPIIISLAEDRQWRVRISATLYIPLLAQQLGVEFFNKQLLGLSHQLLTDCVATIRAALGKSLAEITGFFGAEWAQQVLIPKIMDLSHHNNYLYRITLLQTLALLVPSLEPDFIENSLISPIFSMSKDPVANVRINVCKVVAAFSKKLSNRSYASLYQPLLSELQRDSDHDVQYFATQALLDHP
eukprot:TRINITY_DN7410_c0_g1_i1.p1 TRINITY_DN7410_c0_g1~~TRINITY_DN7410_c0_g1_i1.p1  ORF type:complete len:579 (-),score=83.02 TRINITY_DN7410_c0_g1_i1:34-1770(-)